MSADNPFQNSLRRSTAIAVWSFLAILLALVTPDGSTEAAVFVVVLVSTLCAFALLIVGLNSSDEKYLLPAVVSFGIAVAWAQRLAAGKESSVSAILIAIAFIPVALVYIAVRCHSRTKSLDSRHSASRIEPELAETFLENSADHHVLNPVIGLYETESLHADEALGVWKSPDSPDVTQWLTRSLTADGDVIEGGVRIEFADGQRDATIHVSFCPAFRRTPDVTMEDLDSAGVEIRVAAAFPFGARMTVRRTADNALGRNGLTAETCRIGFVAFAMSAQRAA